MGDTRRFNLFAKLIETQFPQKNLKIADIAGGKGYLQVALREIGYSDVITFDKRKKEKRTRISNLNFVYRFFSENIKGKFDLLIAMHPDEATDITIIEASKRNIPFVIVPCCVKPYATILKLQHNYTNWLNHLKNVAIKRDYNINEFHLKMNGKNIVIVGKPKTGG